MNATDIIRTRHARALRAARFWRHAGNRERAAADLEFAAWCRDDLREAKHGAHGAGVPGQSPNPDPTTAMARQIAQWQRDLEHPSARQALQGNAARLDAIATDLRALVGKLTAG